MPLYNWEGRTRTGDIRTGTMEADSDADVQARLRAQNILPGKIKKKAKQISIPNPFGGVKQKDLVVFTRQLATMIDAGLPIVQCLDILAAQAASKNFQEIIYAVKGDVESGTTLSEAMRRKPKAFNELYTNLVAAGEVGGILDRILNRLAIYSEKAQKLKRQVRGAMVYPAVILLVSAIVVMVLLWKVIPVFETMFKEMGGGAALPKPTQMVINLSTGFRQNIVYIFGGIGALVFGFRWALSTPQGRRMWDGFLLRVVLIGPLLRKGVVARFARTLGTLLTSGVAILDALDIVGKTAGNAIIADAIFEARQQISEGHNMTEPLTQANVFPYMVVQMISVGEQTGTLPTMLEKIADFYEEEVDVGVTALMRLMEPLMMVVLGGIVGGLLLAMYLPIFELAGNIKGG